MPLHRFVFGAVFATCTFAATTIPAGAAFTGSAAPTVMREINRERARSGLAPLALDGRLCAIAQNHANDMSRRRYFSHVTPEGIDPIERMRRARLRFHAAGENMGLAQNVLQAQTVIWNDPPHRSVLLMRAYRKLGIGTSHTAGGTILVEDFSD